MPSFVRTCPATGLPCTNSCPFRCAVKRARKQARIVYQRMRAMEAAADCGGGLLMHVSPSYASDSEELDRLMLRLREIDPRAPA